LTLTQDAQRLGDVPGPFGRRPRPEPPIEPLDRETLMARLGGAPQPKEPPVEPVEEGEMRKRSAMPAAGQAWRRALEPLDGDR